MARDVTTNSEWLKTKRKKKGNKQTSKPKQVFFFAFGIIYMYVFPVLIGLLR